MELYMVLVFIVTRYIVSNSPALIVGYNLYPSFSFQESISNYVFKLKFEMNQYTHETWVMILQLVVFY